MKYTQREIEIINLVKQDLSNAEIGQTLGISQRTVSSLLRTIYIKAGIKSDAGTSRQAREALKSIE
jgi:DNA-binding CsgD family transcriptional regulator